LIDEGYSPDKATAAVFKQHSKTRLAECRADIEQVQDPNLKTLLQKSVAKKTEHIRKLTTWLETHI
jgi:bacterioferritin (cytochrome b1)